MEMNRFCKSLDFPDKLQKKISFFLITFNNGFSSVPSNRIIRDTLNKIIFRKNSEKSPISKYCFPYCQVIRRIRIGIPGTPQMFVEEFFGILRNTFGIPIFVPWLQGVGSVKNRGVQNKTVWVAAESFSQKF
jgi:hypothetical protein